MKPINRSTIGFAILLLLAFLICGTWPIVEAIPEYEPFGYGASGIGIVADAAILGGIVVIIFALMITWYRLDKPSTRHSLPGGRTPNLLVYWVILSVCGWLGTFLTLTGMARDWNWQEMTIGLITLTVASLATLKIALACSSQIE